MVGTPLTTTEYVWVKQKYGRCSANGVMRGGHGDRYHHKVMRHPYTTSTHTHITMPRPLHAASAQIPTHRHAQWGGGPKALLCVLSSLCTPSVAYFSAVGGVQRPRPPPETQWWQCTAVEPGGWANARETEATAAGADPTEKKPRGFFCVQSSTAVLRVTVWRRQCRWVKPTPAHLCTTTRSVWDANAHYRRPSRGPHAHIHAHQTPPSKGVAAARCGTAVGRFPQGLQ